MTIRLGIIGFGRIGRNIFRAPGRGSVGILCTIPAQLWNSYTEPKTKSCRIEIKLDTLKQNLLRR